MANLLLAISIISFSVTLLLAFTIGLTRRKSIVYAFNAFFVVALTTLTLSSGLRQVYLFTVIMAAATIGWLYILFTARLDSNFR